MDGVMGEVHSHTWEVAMGIAVVGDKMVLFSEIEKKINTLLDRYQDKYLNSIPPFDVVNPTVENVCEYLYKEVSKAIQESGWMLLNLEMSETPSRVYHISELDSY
jgi:6-pyruvoyltetrahydropterin/6-carboxytetrahydropterin synthase